MMKMRSKRDRRPLLTHEAPILSDQMPFNPDEEDQTSGTMVNQLNEQAKKASWKRLFGKGGASKRKQDENSLLTLNGGREERDINLRQIEYPHSSSLENQDHQHRQHQQQEQEQTSTHPAINKNTNSSSYQSSRVSDKRDDTIESSQSEPGTNKQVWDMRINADIPQPPQNSSKSRSKSKSKSFMRSLKKKSSQDLSSPLSAANCSVTAQQSKLEDQTSTIVASRNYTKNHNKKSPGKPSTQQQKRASTSLTPLSSASMMDVGDGAKYNVKKILSKPFGREHILMTEQTWVVYVSRAEWDPEDSLWKYRINVKKRDGSKLQDFATCFTLRSLEDFAWLERSLLAEFFGGLLLPNLSIYLGLPDIFNCQHEVDSQLLCTWLSDTLNGIRGQGELMFSANKVDISISESVEAFLYRSELVGPVERIPNSLHNNNAATPQQTMANNIFGEDNSKWNFFPELCYLNCVALPKPVSIATKRNPSHSPSVGMANTFNIPDRSFVEPSVFDNLNRSLTIHADLLMAERDLIWSWRTRALQAMEKLRILKEQEKYIGAAWKRFAICVSNLFAYEKDIETARLGDSKSRRDLQIPYRKLQKSAVDDCLRILTRQKLERSTPSIEAIYIMLSAYVADLSMVQPSMAAYLNGLKQLALQKSKTESLEKEPLIETGTVDPSGTLADKIQASLKVVKKQLASTIQDDSKGMDGTNDEEWRYRQRQQIQTIENRLLMNEALLKDYMTILCKTAPVRTSRMIYAYLEKELEQCKALHDSALEMKGKINVASKETLSKMIHRHHTETKEDKETEIRLVHRIVNIGKTRKFIKEDGDDHSEEVEKGVELSYEIAEQETQKMKRRDKAMNDCRARIGRWDAKLAMAIMEAVGVSDANVRVEETTRDLRMVRKYAISLKVNVERCSEGLEALRMTILQGGMGDIRDIRADFMLEMKNLLSFAFVPLDEQIKDLPAHLMEREGINLSDPAGWKNNGRGSCGNALNTYVETRDSGTEWLLESLGELLKEYSHRVEAIESFVYMECVGIQLEKHFSQARASALTAFEKKTDITSAINIATRKKMPVLVEELQCKLKNLGPVVSHTTVKEAKEAHLESKTLKQDLHTLAMRRLTRARETSTERAIALMTVWAKEEEGSTFTEQGILEELMLLLHESLKKDELAFYVGASPARI